MTRMRSNRGRRRNRDRAVSPEEQTAGSLEAASETTAPTSGSDATPASETNAVPSERRRRRHRGQGQGRHEPTEVRQATQRLPDASNNAERHGHSPEISPDRGQRASPDGGDQRSRQDTDQEERRGRTAGESREDAGRRQNRRRPARRPTIVPAAGDVFKPGVRVSVAGPEPSAKRPALPVDSDGNPALGCPMLTRTRMGMPFAGGAHIPRCALAWALHSEEEASYCMDTPLVALCWKIHPERIAEIEEMNASRAAD